MTLFQVMQNNIETSYDTCFLILHGIKNVLQVFQKLSRVQIIKALGITLIFAQKNTIKMQ